ncbi:hypothetical protein TWF281_011149 [Arthrobotrys megalospora]
MPSRNDTNPYPYDQLVVLSQSLINDSFHNMHLLADDSDPIKRFHYGKQNDEHDHVNVQLAAPTIQLQATKNFPQLYFIMNMISGTLHLDVSSEDDDDSIWKDYDTTGWVFAFPVNIAQKIVEKTDPRFTKAVNDTGLDPSIFSLAQLYVDTSTSSKYEPSLSSFGTTDWSKEPPEARANLDTFIDKWLKLMQEKDQSILGYTVQHTTDPDNPDQTTFPPTSVDYYVYPWKGESGDDAAADNLPNNALCYLMMSGFRPPPTPPIGLPYTGPYVNGGGTYCLSKSIFWDQWLFPALEDFTKGVTVNCDYPTYTVAALDSDWPVTIDAGYRIEGQEDMLGTLTYTPYEDKSNTWYCKVDSGFGPYKDDVGLIYYFSSAETSIDVSFQPGGQTIDISGVSHFAISTSFDVHRDKSGPITSLSTIPYTNDTLNCFYSMDNVSCLRVWISWKFQLGLSGVSEGGLEISVLNVEEPHSTGCTVNPGDVEYELGQDGIGAAYTSQLLDFMEFGIAELKDVLTSSIQNQHKLFLPGSGAFLMKNPIFNERGDLLVDLEYQGADPPIPPEGNQSSSAGAPAKGTSGTSKAERQTRKMNFEARLRRAGESRTLVIDDPRPYPPGSCPPGFESDDVPTVAPGISNDEPPVEGWITDVTMYTNR